MRYVRRVLHELTTNGWALMHFVVVAIPTWFCVVLALPLDTFASSPGFRFMAAVASEGTWSVVSGLVAVLATWAWFTRSWLAWVGSTVMLSAWHGAVALCALQGNIAGTGSGTYAVLALAATLKIARPVYEQVHRIRYGERPVE